MTTRSSGAPGSARWRRRRYFASLAATAVIGLLVSSCVLDGSWSELPAVADDLPESGELWVNAVSCVSNELCLTGASSVD